MNTTKVCASCGQTKLLCEFMDCETKNTKQYCTCNNCHIKNTQWKKNIKNIKKRSYEETGFLETEKDTNSLEVVKVVVDISTLNSSTKEVVDFLVKFIEEADGFSWIYLQSYSGRSTTTYWYFCSQRHDLAAKSKKHQDASKHRNTKAMQRFKSNVEVSQDIKDFIKEHINLLPREIYAQLVGKGLDSSIHQKQNDLIKRIIILYWRGGNYTCSCFSFTIGLYEKLNQIGVKIRECGIDATYNTNNFGFELYTLETEMNGTEFLLAYLFLENNG
ncbi:hypothetical protein GLOIN_2v1847703 [Rhizophagus clarus]|uniref:Uncharacterized protein n=1 Tax=Rhizophagus clarus TaxID=94130 RepID=A0A8H3QF50_9GLOM|nr:hypothetical protein GLOIN_2v1847703 [Rhizophagus clarus]